ncbi:MAG TPA: NADH:flavin oxidoreductase/NADH oxidase [Candidatus Angelobacter sp.]|jgi:2,4-dienoyl-CoA reductase-like NADH-dependent reductase (Old Yellow Enzyme family)|nr:NADH:flavin oxidoreductase/NADH oxidase [Candidatus Angelobacter sp.]
MANLFDPLQLRGVTLKNRIMVSPMCQYSCVDGMANDWHFVHLGSRAVGQAAAVVTEATAVTPEGRISPDDLGIWSDAHVQPLQRIFSFITSQGSVPGVQLAHAGRKASTAAPFKGGKPISPAEGGWSPIPGPSAVPFADGYQTPEAMSKQEIAATVKAFADGARRCDAAGAKIIEIHGAHGYLLHNFISPLSNVRTDEYGGSFENRIRFVLEVIDAVREVWPEQNPVFLRISATDWVDGGWNMEQSVELARIVKRHGVDLIDSSSAGNVPRAPIPVGPGYQVAFSERLKRDAGVLTGAVGMITDPAQADTIIRSGQADLVILARQLLRDPYWPLTAARALGQDIAWPPQYDRAKR